MMVTLVSVKYEVLFVVVELGSPYRSCWMQLLVLLVIVLLAILFFVGRDKFCCLWAIIGFCE